MNSLEHLICPVCRKPLARENQNLVCCLGHSFDIAGKGYVNLLLSQNKNSRDPGDNKDMARARKRFLDRGYYRALSEGLARVFSQKLSSGEAEKILLDAGCGDGYYTDHLQRSFAEGSHPLTVYGMDISKEAVRLASGRNKDIRFAVASLFDLPFGSSQADFVLNAFAPASDAEFHRVLKENGLLVTVIPGRNHLFELKSVLYDKPYENDEKEPDLPSFKALDQVHIRSVIQIQSHEELSDLLTMTPYYYRTPKEGMERFDRLEGLETAIEFVIGIHERL